MDAAYTSLKKTAFFLALATLIPAAAFGQQFTLSATTVTISGVVPGTTMVTSTTTPTTEISYSATAAYGSDPTPGWLCLNTYTTVMTNGVPITGFSTPSQLTFVVCASEPYTFGSTSQHSATVTLTAASPSGVTPVNITVNYTVGSGGTGGTGGALTFNPAAPSTSTCFGCATSLSFTASTTSATAIAFTLATPGVPWASSFTCNGATAGTISSGSAVTCSVLLNGAGQAAGTLSTQLFIDYSGTSQSVTISFGNGSGTGGTSSGSLVVSSSTVNLPYSTATPTSFPSASVTISSSTGAATSYNFSCSSGNNWLEASAAGNTPLSIGSGTLPGTLTITVDSNVESLAAGQSNGTITIDGSDGSVIQISVVLTVNGASSSGLTLSPSPLAISAALNGAAMSQSVTIISTTGGAVTASITGQGLSVSAPASSSIGPNVSTTVTVTGSPTALTAQTYTGQLTVNVGGVTQYDEINFTVGSGSTGVSGSSLTAAPSVMTFASEIGFESGQFQSVYLAGSGNYTAAVSTANGVNWLSVSTSSGTLPLPSGVTVEANSIGLAAGTYMGTVTFTNSSTGVTSAIGVTLTVTGTTAIYASPGDLVFNYIAGTTSATQTQSFGIATTDGSTVSVGAFVSNPSNTPWLTAVLNGTEVTATVNASSLANGIYTGYITISGTAANSPVSVPVVVGVTGSSVSTGTGSLTLSQSSLTLQAQVNGVAVSTSLTVTTTFPTTFSVSSQVTSGGTTWLSVSPSGTATTNTTLTIAASPAGLATGTYTGDIYLTANGTTQTVPVTLVVGTTSSGGSVSVTANGGTSTSPSLTFTASAVGAAVPTQYLSVSSAAGQGSVTFQTSVTTNNGVSWITLSTTPEAPYATPYSPLTVSVNTSALSTGTFTGSVIITPTGGTAVTVPVTLTIAGAATIAVSNTSLNFSYQAGGATPNTQSVSVTVSNASSGAFTATATSSTAGWLAVTPTSGTAPGTLIVSITPAGLSAGTYTGSIAVAGASGATGSATINVTLTVTVPLPTITAVVDAASFVNEAISPGEIITIGGTSIGPATPASFTVANGLVPTTLGGVQVLIQGYAAPVLYVSPTQINAIVPYEIAGILNPTVLVKFLGQSSNGFTVNGAATAVGLFTQNDSGSGPGAILNPDLSLNTASNSAARGSEIVLYMTGEGQTNPGGVDGKLTPTAGPYPAPLLPIAVTIGGAPASVVFMGEAPGLVSGVLEVNVIVPSNLTITGAVPVSVTFGTNSTSQGGVTVNIH